MWGYSPLQGKHLLAEEHRIPTVRTSDGYHAPDRATLLTADDYPSAAGAGYDCLSAGDDRPFAGAYYDCLSSEAHYGQSDNITVTHLPTKAAGHAVLDTHRLTPFGDLVYLFLSKSHASTPLSRPHAIMLPLVSVADRWRR